MWPLSRRLGCPPRASGGFSQAPYIAMEKARLKANGDLSKWEEFQTQTNARLAAYAAPADWMARAARGRRAMTEEERFALR
jgi:hypothetical protein